MITSIQHFGEFGIKNIEKTIEKFMVDPKNHAELIYGITENVVRLGLDIITETLNNMDEELRSSIYRKVKWSIVRKDENSLLTSLGNVTYKKTLFINKETGERAYLLDQIMGLESHTRLTEDAQARILQETVESSYRKGGEQASIIDSVSKETVKNKIHNLRFDLDEKVPEKKKQARILYINADEDHVAAQFWNKKGDLRKEENGRENNTIIPKLIYVYEDIIPENGMKKSKRNKLVNVHYFGGLYEGKENAMLWKEVAEYIDRYYDSEYLEKVYLCGDGANWIKAGCDWIDKSIFVLDRYHRNKYINNSVSHMLDHKKDVIHNIMDCFSFEDKRKLNCIYKELSEYADTDSKKEAIETARKYLIKNWDGIVIYNNKEGEIKGCSAEGHVSHVYSSRMSSRPYGWSKKGADKMSKLRIYYYNKGSMLELVRKQKQPLKEVSGTEKLYSVAEIIASERNRNGDLGKYVEAMTYTIPYPQIKKIANFKRHIWGL